MSGSKQDTLLDGNTKTYEINGKTLETLASESPQGSLIDIAPTVLRLLGLPQPEEMTGSTLV